MSSDKLNDLAARFASLSLLETKEFSEALTEKLGVRPLPWAPTRDYDYRNVPGGMPIGGGEPPMYALRITSMGTNRVPVMAFLRERFRLSIAEAKKAVDAGEGFFSQVGNRYDVEILIADLRRLGAVATLEVDWSW